MKRWLIVLILLIIVVASSIPAWLWFRGQVEPPIRVGILHSQTGAMAISEKSMIDAEVMALARRSTQGRPAGRSPGRVGDRRRPFRLADVCPGSTTIDR